MKNMNLEAVIEALGSYINEQKSEVIMKKYEIADLERKLETAEARVKELEASKGVISSGFSVDPAMIETIVTCDCEGE